MPAKSKDQQRAAGMALAAKRGEMKASELQGASKEMYDSMSEKDLEDFAKTKHDDLPEKVEEAMYGQLNTPEKKVAAARGVLNKVAKIKANTKLGADEMYDQLMNAVKGVLNKKEAEAFIKGLDEGKKINEADMPKVGDRIHLKGGGVGEVIKISHGTIKLKQGTKKRLLYPERVKLKNGSWIEEGYNDYNWIDSPDERMKRLNESLNCDIINEGLSTGEMNDLVKTLYKSVDLNVDDDFAIEMIIISADEFMGKRINKNDAKKVLAQFDKKYPRFK